MNERKQTIAEETPGTAEADAEPTPSPALLELPSVLKTKMVLFTNCLHIFHIFLKHWMV